MFQKIIDKVSYDFYVRDSHNYFEDNILPSAIYDIFKLTKENISPDTEQRCNENISKLEKNMKKGGYTIPVNEALEFYPIFVSDKLDLLGEYVSNSPFCQFLEPGSNPNELVIRLDGNSSNQDLNTFGSILKQPYGFKNLLLIFDYDPVSKINFLKLKMIWDVNLDMSVYPTDTLWVEYLQSGYLEMFIVQTFQHALWHLMTAYITCVARETIRDRELVKVFESNEQNIFNKANEVKAFFLQSPLLFNTIVYGNPVFMNYAADWINTFVNTFDIDTNFSTYLLRGLNPEQQWIPGFRENLQVIKKFASDIISNTKCGDFETDIWSWNCYKNVNPPDRKIRISKLIEILYTIGSVYHSNTFEYQKLGFTELIYSNQIPKNFFLVLLSTLDWNVKFPVFGNYKYYSGYRYINCFKNLELDLEQTRRNISEQTKSNQIYRPFIYSDQANEHYSINTWSTRV